MWTSPARFKIAPCGRRGGKTELAKRHHVDELRNDFLHPKPWPNPRYFAAAPTRDQAREIWWEDLKDLIPASWLAKKPSESKLTITTKWRSMIQVVGLDKPARIEGPPWDGGTVDELANCKPKLFDAHIRPALSDRGGWCWLIGVPDEEAPGQIEYARMVDNALTDAVGWEDWDVFQWPSVDILPASEIAAMKATMDVQLYEQEILGRFIIGGGLAFKSFDYKTHVKNEAVYDPALPLCWSLDFNIDPMCNGLIQHKDGVASVIKEFVLRDTDTETACDHLIEWCEQNNWNMNDICVYGDPTGHARDSTGTSATRTDYVIIRRMLKNYTPHIKVPKTRWLIKDTLNSTRAMLKTADDRVRIRIHPSCKILINDIQTVLWPSDMSEGHSLAWFRYFCHRQFPVRSEIVRPTGQFSVNTKTTRQPLVAPAIVNHFGR